MTETPRLKRLRLRSWRRGTKEMDLILGPFADRRAADMSEDALALYEALLEENDQDLYRWVAGTAKPPAAFSGLLAEIRLDVEARREG